MYGIFDRGLLRRQVEFLEYLLICLWILFEPSPDCNFESIIVYMIEHSASGLIFIRADEWAMPIMMIPLFVVFLFPNILVHFRTGYPSFGRISPRIVTYPMGHDAV